jgi:hypothetical protein
MTGMLHYVTAIIKIFVLQSQKNQPLGSIQNVSEPMAFSQIRINVTSTTFAWMVLPHQNFVQMASSSRCQFHKHFMSSFFIHKVFLASFIYLQFGFVIFGNRKSAQKLFVKCW